MRKGRNNGLAVAKQKDNNYFTEIYYIPSDFDVLLITRQRLIIIDSLHYLFYVERVNIKASTKKKADPWTIHRVPLFYMYLLIEITFG